MQNDTITDMEALHVVANFYDFTDDFVTGVRAAVGWESGRCDAQVTIKIDQVQVAVTYTGEMIAHTHPVRCGGQLLPWKILDLQGCE